MLISDISKFTQHSEEPQIFGTFENIFCIPLAFLVFDIIQIDFPLQHFVLNVLSYLTRYNSITGKPKNAICMMEDISGKSKSLIQSHVV